MDKAEFFWTLQRISQEKRCGNLYINSSNFLCSEGAFAFYHPALLNELLPCEVFEIAFERSAQVDLEDEDRTQLVSPGHFMLDMIEEGFSILVDGSAVSCTTQAVESIDEGEHSDVEIENANISVDNALREAMQEKDLGSEIGLDLSGNKSEQDDSSQDSFLGSIKPMTANHKTRGLYGQIQSFNYTCLVPEVSRGLVTIIGFGFIAFSAFIVPRLFSGLFKAIANMVTLS